MHIIASNVYDLKKQKDFKFIEKETENNVIKRGLIEKIFGGVGPQTEIPTSENFRFFKSCRTILNHQNGKLA